MIKTIHKVVAWLIILIGCSHLLVTLFTYHTLSPQAVWFASAGLAVIFAGFLNFIFLTSGAIDHLVQKLCLIANLTVFVIFILLILISPELHIFVGAAAFITATFFTMRTGKI